MTTVEREILDKIEFPICSYYTGQRVTVAGELQNFKKEDLVEGVVYIYNDCLWKYYETVPSTLTNYPIFSFVGDEIVTRGAIDRGEIPLDAIINKSLRMVVQKSEEGVNYTKDLLPVQSASSTAIYVPEIKEDDDFLKKLIKRIFLIKQVATSGYKRKFSKGYSFSNLYQSLNGKTKMSTVNWQTWIELLGLDCILILKDNGGDKESPINDYVVYKSRNDTIEVIEKDKIDEFLSENL